MTHPAHTLVCASLLGDALALPAHWNYEPASIAARWERLSDLEAPDASGYHGGQPRGGQTHYGMQALLLLEALAAAGGRFEPAAFMTAWRAFWASNPPSYVDGATRETLAHLAAGADPLAAGSASSDWGGAARMAPLVAATLAAPEEEAVAAVMAQTELTHRDPVVIEAAAYWARAVRRVRGGEPVPLALAHAAGHPYVALPIADWLERAHLAAAQGAVGAVQALGPACGVAGALPATLAVALCHPFDLEAALIESAMAGGDSAARGLALGMLLGAVPGARLPERWLGAWQARGRVDSALERLAVG